MDINQKLKENIKEEFLLLKKETQEVLENFKFKNIFIEIGKNNKLSDKEIINLETETILVLIGLVNAEQFSQNIEYNIGTSTGEAKKIESEVVSKIFNPITEAVIKKIKDKLKNDLQTNDFSNEDIPRPPYAKGNTQKETVVLEKKESIATEVATKPTPSAPEVLPVVNEIEKTGVTFEENDARTIEEKRFHSITNEEKKFSPEEDKLLSDLNINIVNEEIPNKKEFDLPNSADKDLSQTVSQIINSQNTKSTFVPKDPYHEPLE